MKVIYNYLLLPKYNIQQNYTCQMKISKITLNSLMLIGMTNSRMTLNGMTMLPGSLTLSTLKMVFSSMFVRKAGAYPGGPFKISSPFRVGFWPYRQTLN